VLWDMDGTLIDSEPYWIEAEMSLAQRFGAVWTYDDALTLVGSPLDVSAQILRERGIDLAVEQIIATLLERVTARARDHMPWMDDARTLLHAVHAQGIPCALVTMSRGEFVEAFLDQAGDVFSVVVTGDQVARGKPHPEAYLRAAQLLGVDARECVAIEDSSAGVRSAHAAGARTIAVVRHVQVPQLEGMVQVASLEGVTPADLAAYVHGVTAPALMAR